MYLFTNARVCCYFKNILDSFNSTQMEKYFSGKEKSNGKKKQYNFYNVQRNLWQLAKRLFTLSEITWYAFKS